MVRCATARAIRSYIYMFYCKLFFCLRTEFADNSQPRLKLKIKNIVFMQFFPMNALVLEKKNHRSVLVLIDFP